MKNAAFALLLLMVGCAPTQQEIEQHNPSVAFVVADEGGGNYVSEVYASEPAVIRKLVVQARGIASPDASCQPWFGLVDAISCGEGEPFRAAPGGYRVRFSALQTPVGQACVVLSSLPERIICRDMRFR